MKSNFLLILPSSKDTGSLKIIFTVLLDAIAEYAISFTNLNIIYFINLLNSPLIDTGYKSNGFTTLSNKTANSLQVIYSC